MRKGCKYYLNTLEDRKRIAREEKLKTPEQRLKDVERGVYMRKMYLEILKKHDFPRKEEE